MNLLSKDAPLDISLSNMQKVLSDIELEFCESKHPLKNIYSTNLSYKKAAKHIYSNGKGSSSEATKASAMGEFIERLQCNLFFSDFYIGDMKHFEDEVLFEFGGDYLSDELYDFYDKNDELSFVDLLDFNSDYEDKVLTLPFKNLQNSQVVHFPINILHNLYMSNGMASGNTLYEAKVQALCEIFERYVKFEVIKNGFALPKFSDEHLRACANISNDIKALERSGFLVAAYDASLGGHFPVVAISLINQNENSLFVSFGSHPILEVALERTLSELLQGRELNELSGFSTPSFDMELVGGSLNLESHFIDSDAQVGFGFLKSVASFEFCEWNFSQNETKKQYEQLLMILEKEGKSAYIREYDYLGFFSVQIIVPSMSEVYPLEDLLLNNKNRGKFLRDMVLDFSSYDAEDTLYEFENFNDNEDVAKLIGVIFKDEVKVYHIKAQASLVLKNYEDVLYLLNNSQKSIDKAVCELIRAKLAMVDIKEYEDAFIIIFGKSVARRAKDILNGKELLFDVSYDESYLNILALYEKIKVGKHAI